MAKIYNNSSSAAVVLTRPRITEKATFLSNRDSGAAYTFEVSGRANKALVSKAVRELFKVTPTKVNIINTRPKKVFSRGKRGVVGGIKKAMVYLKKGEKIDII